MVLLTLPIFNIMILVSIFTALVAAIPPQSPNYVTFQAPASTGPDPQINFTQWQAPSLPVVSIYQLYSI